MKLPSLNLFKKKKKPQAPQKGLEFLFECGGQNFYHYPDELMMPAMRALSATDMYEELSCRIEKSYLKVYFQSVIDLVNKGKIMELATITKLAMDRLDHITHIDMVYKLASILYVSEDEDPNRFSLSYSEKKIKLWKEFGGDTESFFLSKPIGELVPFSALSKSSIQAYSVAQMEEISRSLEYHINILSSCNASNESLDSLTSQIDKNKDLIAFLNSQ